MIRDRRAREYLLAWLHLTVLWSFAFAQPLLDLLGQAPEFFVARENTRGEIILLAIVVTLVAPLVLVGLEALAGVVSQALRRAVHLVLVAVLVAAFALQLLKDGPGGTAALLIPIATGIGLMAAAVYARTRVGPMLLTALGPAPLVFIVIFLLISPVSKLVLPGDAVEASEVDIPGNFPVVMVVFDEFSGVSLLGSDGRINASRYPSFARLARESTWYRDATTVADFTDRAVPALLTGERPRRGAVPIASDHPESLFTLLGGKYSFDVTEPVTDICPKRFCPRESVTGSSGDGRLRALASDLSVVTLHLLLPDDLTDDLPRVDRSFEDFRELAGGADTLVGGSPISAKARLALAGAASLDERQTQFRGFSRRLSRSPARARLSFLHLQLPHTPYEFLPTGQRYRAPGVTLDDVQPGKPLGTWPENRWIVNQQHQRYLLQVGYADRLVGQLMARLRSGGLYRRSLIVVMADHGASFLPGESHRRASDKTLAEIASIPLFVKAPGQLRGRVDGRNVHSIDVLPTIAARLGIRLPWKVEGRPADSARRSGRILMQSRYQGDISLPFREFISRRDALVGRMLADFGETPGELYRAGPDGDLVGRPLATLKAPVSNARFKLDDPGNLAAVDPSGPVAPSYVAGEVTGLTSKARLAIVVNGRVAASTVTVRKNDARHFSAIVAPTAFVRGENTVEVISVTGAGTGRRIERLRRF